MLLLNIPDRVVDLASSFTFFSEVSSSYTNIYNFFVTIHIPAILSPLFTVYRSARLRHKRGKTGVIFSLVVVVPVCPRRDDTEGNQIGWHIWHPRTLRSWNVEKESSLDRGCTFAPKTPWQLSSSCEEPPVSEAISREHVLYYRTRA